MMKIFCVLKFQNSPWHFPIQHHTVTSSIHINCRRWQFKIVTNYLQGNNKMFDDYYKKLYKQRWHTFVSLLACFSFRPCPLQYRQCGPIWNRSRTKSTFLWTSMAYWETQCGCRAGQQHTDGAVWLAQTCCRWNHCCRADVHTGSADISSWQHHDGEMMSTTDLKELHSKSYVYNSRPPENKISWLHQLFPQHSLVVPEWWSDTGKPAVLAC